MVWYTVLENGVGPRGGGGDGRDAADVPLPSAEDALGDGQAVVAYQITQDGIAGDLGLIGGHGEDRRDHGHPHAQNADGQQHLDQRKAAPVAMPPFIGL